ncbi:MAG TPA: fluoride efflux transporter CrcB [Vicinamibacterales bacterium]|jgi:CrcB protein|nr:fluoride efflux transporter CrcB [Vicinamibacterales bacterium]
MVSTWIAVAVGGALGSLARHWVNVVIAHRLEKAVPYATFTVNIIGCVIIGALAGTIARGRVQMSPLVRTFIFVGVLGGFTTFSSFGLDTFTLAHGGEHAAAFWNVVGQVGLGLGGVYLGYQLAL